MSTTALSKCSVPDCERPAVARGWCGTHYQRWQRRGDVRADLPIDTNRGAGVNYTPSLCSVAGCEEPARTRGWCIVHYQHWLRNGDPVKRLVPAPRVCAVEGCTSLATGRGWCPAHYQRWARHGDPLAGRISPDPSRRCLVESCQRKTEAKGLCTGHYSRWRAAGQPPLGEWATTQTPIPPSPARTPVLVDGEWTLTFPEPRPYDREGRRLKVTEENQ